MKCAGASTCVPVCAPKLSIETFAASYAEMLRQTVSCTLGSPGQVGNSLLMGTLMS